MLLFTGIALTTSSASSDVIISEFDQNHAGSDEANEWVSLETHLTDIVRDHTLWQLHPPGRECILRLCPLSSPE
jgi:hypothetical protein